MDDSTVDQAEYTHEPPPEGFSLELEAQNTGDEIVQRAAVLTEDDTLDPGEEDGSADDDDFVDDDDDDSIPPDANV